MVDFFIVVHTYTLSSESFCHKGPNRDFNLFLVRVLSGSIDCFHFIIFCIEIPVREQRWRCLDAAFCGV